MDSYILDAYDRKYEVLAALAPGSPLRQHMTEHGVSRELQQECRARLREAVVYAWHPEITEAVVDSANALPPWNVEHIGIDAYVLNRSTIPPEPCWYWMDPAALLFYPVGDDLVTFFFRPPHEWSTVAAIPIGRPLWFPVDDDDPRIEAEEPVSGQLYASARRVLSSLSAERRRALRDLASQESTIVAGLAWLQQRYGLLRSAPLMVDRHARKRAQRIDAFADGHVEVILLRRPFTAHDGEQQTGRQYSCRFPVMAHWRQLREREGEKRITWVRAYLKGPADKPLRLPGERIFAVVR